MVVVLSHAGDPHAVAVMGHLRARGRDARLLDLSWLPDRGHLSIGHAPDGDLLEMRMDDGAIDLAAADAFWWRRPQAPDLAGVREGDARAFAWNEWREAVDGVWQLAGGRWMNPPTADDVACRKAHQLRVAREAGLGTPRTLMTSDPERARAFLAELGGPAVFKTFACTHAVWRETRVVRPEEIGLLDAVALCPVIFQELVPAEADVRVTVVGARMFPAEIRIRPGDHPVDFRPALAGATVRRTALPTEVEAGIRGLMDRLGLVYGAVDLRRTPDGDHVFLEVNTAGEFLFVEERTGLPLTEAVADWLTGDV